ncbi:MAG TPA: GNAT family N-acetyltransferase [Terriglobales bacterium]|nr:GNAT family N-acetyltransferase [Terriglobales bacterium]
MSGELPIRPITAVEELEACVEMQSQVWGFGDRDLVPRRMLVVANKIGGLVLGAWDGPRLAGFALALPGNRQGKLYWHSHMLAVAEGYRDRGLGRQLKLRQRQEALTQGIEWMEWTFDPLEIKNGYFNLAGLGAVSRRYYPNLYGQSSSMLQAGLPTDRVVAEWWLRSPRVVALAQGKPVAAAPVAAARVEVPAEIYAWKRAGDPRAAELQRRNREALLAAFADGLMAVGYARSPQGGVFLLAREVA